MDVFALFLFCLCVFGGYVVVVAGGGGGLVVVC